MKSILDISMVTVRKRLDLTRRRGFLWVRKEYLCEVQVESAYSNIQTRKLWTHQPVGSRFAVMTKDLV